MVCALAGLAAGAIFSSPPTRLTFLSVGQGDCAIFQTEGGTVLIDAGPKSPTYDAGKRIVLPDLDRLGVESVDLVFLSHPDEDHIGGLGAILKAYPTAKIAISSQFASSAEMQAHLREWNVNPQSVLWLGPSAEVKVGEFTLDVRDPPLPPGEPDNAGSMFIHLVHGPASAVFSGDAGAKVEKLMEPIEDWRSQVLKVGHHGSRSSTDSSWLQEVQPKYAVISCGRNNVYGHPAKSTLNKLQSAGIAVWRTDQEGDLSFRYDAQKGFLPQERGL